MGDPAVVGRGADLLADLSGVAVLDAVGHSVLVTDRNGTVVHAGPAAVVLYGRPVDALLGLQLDELLAGDGSGTRGAEVLAAVLAGQTWRGEHRSRLHVGTALPALATAGPLRGADGQVCGVVLVEQELPAAQHAAKLVTRLIGLARIATELGTAPDLRAVSDIVCSHAASVLGANAASLALLVDDDTLELLGAAGGPPEAARQWSRFGVDAPNPASEAVRTGAPVTAVGRAALTERYPDLFPGEDSERSLVSLPLSVSGRCLGVVSLSFAWLYEFSGADAQFLQTLADTCAQALARLTAVAAATDRSRQLTFLAEASSALADTLDYEATLGRVADLVVPTLADWCGIDLLDDGVLRPVAVAHADPAKVALARELRQRYPVDMSDARGAPAVLRTGRSELYPQISDEVLVASARDPEHLRLIRELRLHSMLMVPLTARGRVLGVLTLIASGSRVYTDLDVVFAEELGRRAGLALDNAQVHSEMLEASLRLQNAVLPATFDNTGAWQVAAYYRPAGRTEVGGDFYDAVPLPDGRLVVLVGDVMGRGVAAAAAMAQIRAALRAYFAIDPDPVSVLERLTVMFDLFDLAQLVTVLYGVVDPARGQVQLVSAGHLPPLLVHPDGVVQRLVVPSSPPLGAGSHPRSLTTVPFRPGDTLLLVTDGAVERRGEDIDTGLVRLAGVATRLHGDLSDAALGALAEELNQPGHDDDVTMIAVRHTG